MYECETCTASFYYEYQCEQHMDRYGHWPECQICTRVFRTQRACKQHMNDLDHWAPTFECETCDSTFGTQQAAYQHMTALGHWTPKIPCETCTKRFHTQNAANQHMNACNHWAPQIPCETCGQKFHTQEAANRHMEQLSHYKAYCGACKRSFQNMNNLKMHLNSKIHQGSNVSCPFCKKNYTTASGVAHHLETGSCTHAPTLNRDSILRMIRQRDRQGIITKKQIEWHQDDNFRYSATARAFNGCRWECYLCHRTFNTDTALNAHLNSPVHRQKVYHCPNSTAKCGKEFASLAGLFNHLESETCGFTRFEHVQKRAGSVFQGRMLITF